MTDSHSPPLDLLDAPDPELIALPPPRRPFRNLTLGVLGLNGALALSLMVALRTEFAYVFAGGQPTDVGDLAQFSPHSNQADTWIRGAGTLDGAGVNYRRPLDPDRFRAVPIAGNPKLWVELREPGDSNPEYFVPPASVVGRLTRFSEPGLLHQDVANALLAQKTGAPPPDAWLVVDAESPQANRWLLGLLGLLLGFAAFSIFGLLRLAGRKKARTLVSPNA